MIQITKIKETDIIDASITQKIKKTSRRNGISEPTLGDVIDKNKGRNSAGQNEYKVAQQKFDTPVLGNNILLEKKNSLTD